MFESRISASATEKLPGRENLTQEQSHGPTTWKDMLENALSDTANWQTKKWSNDTKVSSPCLDDQFKQKNLNQSENYHKFAHKLS